MAIKSKKNLRKRINPEKSNKMIYAVGGGLAIFFALILFLVMRSGTIPSDPTEIMTSTLKYLEKTGGVRDVIREPLADRVTIVYEPVEKVDIIMVTQYAGIRLSHRLPGHELEVRLGRFRPDNLEYIFWVKDGKVLRHKAFTASGESDSAEKKESGDKKKSGPSPLPTE